MSDEPIVLSAMRANNEQLSVAVPQSIQRHGALLAFDLDDLHVLHTGGDTLRLWGMSPMALLGTAAVDLLLSGNLTRLRNLLESGRPLGRPVWVFDMVGRDHTPVDAIAHVIGGLLVLEFEPRLMPAVDDAMDVVQGMVRHVQQQRSSLQALYDVIAREVQRVTEFDRVMVLRFAEDGGGAVVADVRRSDMDSFLGLNFASTHIPKRDRVLHLENWIRNIPNAADASSAIIPSLDPWSGLSLDLSRSLLRGVSPEYRRFLTKLGIAASVSLSLVVRGQLWGLIVCHHRDPRYLPHRLRDVLELFAEVTSSHLEMRIIEAGLEAQLHSTRVLEQLVARMSLEPDLTDALLRERPNLLDLVPAEGVGLWVDGRFTGFGSTPSLAQIERLVGWLNATVHDGIFHTACLSSQFPAARAFADVASGLLALSVSKTPRDYVLWFRPEMSRTVSWSSNPAEPVETNLNGAYLTPRGSFAAWQEHTRLHAADWLPAELEAAHRLRVALLEVVLARIDRTSREREAARQQQEILARELDLRLEQWQTTAEALCRETERRAVAEAELSQVLRRTVSNQEAERLRIARELHDTLGQSLALLQLGLEGLANADAGVDFHQRLAALKSLAQELGRDVSGLAWEIRPTALGDLPIRTAIKNYLENWSERSAIPFDLHLTLHDKRLSPDVETTLYRVLQEAMTNVVRHANATRVGVILGATDKCVTMIIDDDGCGFTTNDAAPGKRLGLLGVRERLALVNGSLEVESVLGRGTTLFIRIPL